MSHYAEVQCEFKDVDALVSALEELRPAWKGQIRVLESPEHLYGYHGDVRPEVAHLIVPRAAISGASNDIGFVRGDDGRYSAIVSDYDRSIGYNAEWLGKLKQMYAKNVVLKQARKQGLHFLRSEERDDGSIKITLEV